MPFAHYIPVHFEMYVWFTRISSDLIIDKWVVRSDSCGGVRHGQVVDAVRYNADLGEEG